ncbi:N-acetylglucosamine 6-phosphate deacetylase [Melghirimyces profundicolus]|uniref:N-acetylglucosamine-6-phosphate deacetylase n=2 Tax=Melghirimyces profundicolus TaxID=1242148 RepID=A0A2T6AV22_9BACL|nr:N-acetylglucosamine 6-phosphate deacetylase [Melghirimyces profundicolus]
MKVNLMAGKRDICLSGRVLTPAGIRSHAVIVVKKGIIEKVEDRFVYGGLIDLDVGDSLIAPGFVDIHVHGGYGNDFMSGSVEEIAKALHFHAMHGTTSILPTTVTASHECTSSALQAIGQMIRIQKEGAEHDLHLSKGSDILGVHLEGPFINPGKAGGQALEWIRPFDMAEYEAWEQIVPIRMITLAPELEGAEPFIRFVAVKPVLISAGHTDAKLDDIHRSMKWGVQHLTHFYNAMRSLHHREPGTIGAGLLQQELTVELIADGIHVHPDMLRLAYLTKGADRIALITDASILCGLADGVYKRGGREIIVENGLIRLRDGTLKGSNLTMDRSAQMMIELGVPIEDVWKMAAVNPARWIGKGSRKGAIKPGMDADLIVLDNHFNVIRTIVRGEIIF